MIHTRHDAFLPVPLSSVPNKIERGSVSMTVQTIICGDSRYVLLRLAIRAGIELWEKPFQNCRSSRDTELRKMFPEYLVNRWIGHTQQVAEAHYTQTLPSDFTDAYNTEKKRAKMGVEYAGMGCFGVDVAKNRTPISTPFPTVFQGYSTDCTEKQGLGKMAQIPPRGIEPLLPD